MLPIVARSATESGQPFPVQLHELPECHALAAEQFGHGQDQVSGIVPVGSLPESLSPTTWGISNESGWPSMAALGLDAADAPAQDAQPVDHRRV